MCPRTKERLGGKGACPIPAPSTPSLRPWFVPPVCPPSYTMPLRSSSFTTFLRFRHHPRATSTNPFRLLALPALLALPITSTPASARSTGPSRDLPPKATAAAGHRFPIPSHRGACGLSEVDRDTSTPIGRPIFLPRLHPADTVTRSCIPSHCPTPS